jgi:hypothetical protein
MEQDPDPAIFVSDLQDVNNNNKISTFFCVSWCFFKVQFTTFAWWYKDPDPYLWLMDPDPGGQKHMYPIDPDPRNTGANTIF